MSFSEQLVLWLHIGFAIFTIGPVTLAISSTPRYIRKQDLAIVRYLARITTIFTIGSLAVLVLGIVLGQLLNEFSKPWLTAAMTLFLVTLVLLALIIRDQRKAIRALEEVGNAEVAGAHPGGAGSESEQAMPAAESGAVPASQAAAGHIASVERGRIAAMGGVVNLIWLAVLALMVWQP
jgi:hypothetical protein